MKYISNPVIIDAVEFKDTTESINAICDLMDTVDTIRVDYAIPDYPQIIIPTLEGEMRASVGDFIIKGLIGEFYPCKPSVFNAKYRKYEQ